MCATQRIYGKFKTQKEKKNETYVQHQPINMYLRDVLKLRSSKKYVENKQKREKPIKVTWKST